ncbi:ubiquitin-conjugating enzyme E2 R2 isoform X2 [Formica exsecta]|uniref:ubiquitin-conjugating enzyme E2 R2 isoform X2 n=1 Tax=Formica exsecta TaxID=72781 RepID=UPI001144A883|nr:ubiquitin-conjugating enzyme E2 R2 isoform X2 [Formica exsecta]
MSHNLPREWLGLLIIPTNHYLEHFISVGNAPFLFVICEVNVLILSKKILEATTCKAHMKFPPDYPYSPPSIRFMTKVWHPNVYENGDLCISILHPPVDDPQSGELPCERWNPTQNVRTILLSVISLLNEPNTYSPANVDASVMYRRWRDSKGRDKEYENIIRKQAQAAKMEAEKEGIVVPVTLEDYCIKTRARPAEQQLDMTDFYDDEYELDDDEDEQLSATDYEDGDDSGNGES